MRKELGFQQSDVAKCLGVDVDKVQKFELGSLEPKLSEVCALLATFMTRFEAAFESECETATADVYTRIADYEPPKSTDARTANRAKSYRRLKAFLNQPHGCAL